MSASSQKLVKLEQMGLGPVWQRRVLSEAAQPAESATETATAVSADDIAQMDWDALNHAITHCTRCRLCEGRTHAVPGSGAANAQYLFVGEGPGHAEDLQGEPFVGPAGKLLDNMLLAIDLQRGKQTFIANVVKCRPVGADGHDRPPSADEAAACLPYLQRQIALIKPEVIVALGKVAATALMELAPDTALGGLRGSPHQYQQTPVIVTYHPAYLLRKPADKAKSWADLCLAMTTAERVSDAS
jgi:DNA polymerase